MRKSLIIIGLTVLRLSLSAQKPSKEYSEHIKRAESFYNSGEYEKSAYAYSSAFKSNDWKGLLQDRYNAACSWAMAKKPDSSFFNLNRISDFLYIIDKRFQSDPDLTSLHEDKRWQTLLKKISVARDSAEANYNKPLVRKLDSIYDDDQKYRLQLDEIEKNPSIPKTLAAKKKDSLWKIINIKDRSNLLKVKEIIDKYGWLGPDEIGETGNSTLFLVIQHSDQYTQEKYLPIMREAVKNKKAHPEHLALLEDRVAIGKGRKQIYGSQVGSNGDNKSYLLPLENPDSVDIRRAAVGLQPIAEYLEHFNIKWDVEEYKENQKKIEAQRKNNGLEPINNAKYFLGVGVVLFIITLLALKLKRKNTSQKL